MESENELNINIRLTTLKIQEEYPELIKYMKEISKSFSFDTNKSVNNKAQKDYLESLNYLLETYANEH